MGEIHDSLRVRACATLSLVSFLSIVGCSSDRLSSVDTPLTPPSMPELPRRAMVGPMPPEPGSCSFSNTAAGNGTVFQWMNCDLADSSVNQIIVTGTLTATKNSAAEACCSNQHTTWPDLGTYGPMGSGKPSTWMNLLVSFRLQQLNSNNAWSVSAMSSGNAIGSPVGTVTINDIYVIGRPSGVTIRFDRPGLASTASCNSYTSPCPGPATVVDRYAVNGSQSVLVRRMAKTLAVNTLPAGDKYEGDSVTFVAYSTDNRPVSVRQWTWQDTSGVATVVPCSATSTQCRWAPPSSGNMYVQARVGTNPFIEQAAAWLQLVPIVFAISLSPASVVFSDTVTITPMLNPSRSISNFEILPLIAAMRSSGPVQRTSARDSSRSKRSARRLLAASPSVANSTTEDAEIDNILCRDLPSPRCRGVAISSGVVRARAVVNGRPRIATARLEVTPLYITVEGSANGGVIDSLELSGSAPPYQCPDIAGMIGYPPVDREPEKDIASLNHPLVPFVPIGRGLMKSYAPMVLKEVIVNSAYGTGLPLARYLPVAASLITLEYPLPRTAGWTYVKSMSWGIEYQCKTWWSGNMTLQGRLIYNGYMSLTFMAKRP
jgi:hypothetical protein